MSDRFFAIRLILRFGDTGAMVLAVLVGLGLGVHLWPVNLGLALVLPVPLGALAYVLLKSYVEMVSIVFSMVN